jgi:hypothetical protein
MSMRVEARLCPRASFLWLKCEVNGRMLAALACLLYTKISPETSMCFQEKADVAKAMLAAVGDHLNAVEHYREVIREEVVMRAEGFGVEVVARNVCRFWRFGLLGEVGRIVAPELWIGAAARALRDVDDRKIHQAVLFACAQEEEGRPIDPVLFENPLFEQV